MGFGYLITLLFVLVFLCWNAYLRTAGGSILLESGTRKVNVYPIFFLFLAVRLLVAVIADGHGSDMACWAGWGNRMTEVPLSQFYAPDYFCDYPPGYLYILGAVSWTSQLFGLSGNGYYLLLKLPPIFADMLTAYLVFRYASKTMNPRGAAWLSALFLFSPVFFYDSAVWGQIESVLLLFLLVSLLLFQEKRYYLATVVYTLAVLIKPQGILIAPLILVLILESKNIKTILISALLALATFLLVIMPFSPAWQEQTGGALFLQLFNPLWMIDKYLTTMGSYPYFSVNAFNFYAALKLNWSALSTLGTEAFTSLLNYLILAVGVIGSLYLYFKIKDKKSNLWISSYFLFGFLFTFALQMHERYVILSILFLLFAFLSSRNKQFLYLFVGFSCVGFLNMYCILYNFRLQVFVPEYITLLPIALLEVVLFFYSVWVIYRDFLRDKPAPKPEAPVKKPAPQRPIQKKKPTNSAPKRFQFFKSDSLISGQRKMVRLDYLILTGIVLVYSLVAFTNLGDMEAAQTYYKPAQVGETITVTLQKTEQISEINYYCGVGSIDAKNGLNLSYSEDGSNWTDYTAPVCGLKAVFCWQKDALTEPIRAKYLRLSPTKTDYMLFEAGFRNTAGELAPIQSVTEPGTAAFDEQDMVTNMPSYENGTYFDEIYHPRTAFEHLHMLPYYETTHPPLGKLIMAIGIAMFGMTPFGWRFMGTLTGVLMLPLLYLLLKKLFGRTRYATIGTLLFAFDFMHFSLTRLATIDSYPVLFIIGMYYFMYLFSCRAFAFARGESVSTKDLLLPLLFSGIFMGLGCASKWTAVYAAVGLAVEFFVILMIMHASYPNRDLDNYWKLTQDICTWCLLFFVAIPAVIYLFSYLPISMVDGYGNVFQAMWNNQEYMLNYHSALTAEHPYSSPWYTWPFIYRPMWAYMAPAASIPKGTIGCISIFQNPLLSWASVAAFFYSVYAGWKKRDFRVLFLTIGLLAQYLPWGLISRVAFQYHYFASVVFMVMFVVYAMADLEQRFPRFKYVSIVFTVLCLALFIMFYPVISGVPASRTFVDTFLKWFDTWVFFI